MAAGLNHVPLLVAHRGYPLLYPENTLEGLAAAVVAGARYIEFDVQITRDGVPVLLHDSSLLRVAGIDRDVTELSYAELATVTVGEAARLGSRYPDARIASLEQVVGMLGSWQGVTAFVEIKRQSIRRFGRPLVLQAVMSALKPALRSCVLISFDADILEQARGNGCPTGWALRNLDAETQRQASHLSAEYLFCGNELVTGPGILFPGPWSWVVYETSDPDHAVELGLRGADFVETNAIGRMLMDPRLKRRNHPDAKTL